MGGGGKGGEGGGINFTGRTVERHLSVFQPSSHFRPLLTSSLEADRNFLFKTIQGCCDLYRNMNKGGEGEEKRKEGEPLALAWQIL